MGHPATPLRRVRWIVASSGFRVAGTSGILSVMGSRLLDAGVALAALISAVVLGVMLAAPALPGGVSEPAPLATPEPSQTPSADLPPLGLFLLRGPSAFGPCLGLELTPPSYPIGDSASEGVATILWWERGMTGCDSRSNDVAEVEASVLRVARVGAPDETAGYNVAFDLPLGERGIQRAELTILAQRSTQELLQVVDTSGGGGQGLVFDRVEVIDPAFDPIPTPTPVALEPDGLYLLRGPFATDGPCIVLELSEASYPADRTMGSVGIRWWERAVADPSDPAECLTRRGDVNETSGTVVAVTDSNGSPIAYTIAFSVPVPVSGAVVEVEISVILDASTQDQLEAAVIRPEGVDQIGFDRVDSIDPPLGTAP